MKMRESLRISQYQLAKNSGIAEEYLNKLENAKREPKARMIIRLGRGLGIPPGDLLNEMDRLMRLEGDEGRKECPAPQGPAGAMRSQATEGD